ETLIRTAISSDDRGLSASFNEPITNLDYVIDVTELGVKQGLYSMMVTNMYFTARSLEAVISARVDGFSASIKGCPRIRRALVDLDYDVVFKNARLALNLGAHVEIVYLVVTNTNDFSECYEWIIDSHLKYLGPDVPIHINRYYPAHRWHEPATPIEKLESIKEYASRQGLKYLYVGNIMDSEAESTKCPRCGKTLVFRYGFKVLKFDADLSGDKYRCRRCGENIPIRGKYVKKY
ncbi:MAG: radical SAM protein, partial [Desulfurococcaceae archaeon]